ncbi:DegT/DnrJ/EryC1/StrS family aminotransferase [Nitratidesulfovibrio sp.]|uniref:DegT/DnrJ/EryC1/StrS family aminotransferase n=1 Tax=Nitratidesulfovibrio sp. TaxID=2802297 RepID=UPI00333E2138
MIPFIDLKAQFAANEASIRARMNAVLAHGQYILGPEVAELEGRLAAYCGVRHCVGCASGTDALQLALMAESIGPGDAVITTSFSFIATAEVIALLGARPVFVDIDPLTWNLSPAGLAACLEDWNPAWGRPRAVIAVDMFGLPAAYAELASITREHGLLLIEDAAQGFGAAIGGQVACSFGDYAATSFFPAKPLGCYGDGGAVFCNDPDRAGRLRSLRFHGKGGHKYDNVRIGINSRLDTLQAAVLLAKLDVFDAELAARQRIARAYEETLDGAGIIPQRVPHGCRSAWAQYSFLLPPSVVRAEVQEALQAAGVPSMVYYPIPLHLQTAFAHLGYGGGDLPTSEEVSRRILSLPMHPYMTGDDADSIARALMAALA